ncbi:hypothetical protein ACNVD4_21240, partial [Rhizobium sp. BR5]
HPALFAPRDDADDGKLL